MDYLNEAVFGCSKVYVAARYAITGHYINWDMMTAMYRAMVGTADPTVAILREMACKIRYAAEYRYETAVAAVAK